MIRKLKIDPVGVKFYEISSNSFRLKSTENPKIETHVTENKNEGFPKYRFAISGDYLSDTINIQSKFK